MGFGNAGYNGGVQLSQLDTSAELRAIIGDETGTGAIVNPLPGAGFPQNPLPQFTHRPIVVLCGFEQPDGIECTLRGGAFEQTYHLQPGEQLRFKDSRHWTIEFHRGGPFGEGKYRLIAGLYTFRGTQNGWELFRARQK